MAIKKSQLYTSLWEGCDALRGGMDASQYKDYVLTMLFVKYISDKYAGKEGLITIPEGASFEDMVALKGQKDIGDKINKQIIRPIFKENTGLEGEVELVDFNDDDKLGSDKEKVDLLSNLISIFENPALNFKNNRAEDDDILGDAYEFLMRHFATESGKSKGQFYTPAEVSRVLAQIIGVNEASTSDFSVYDPTCGSGSLLLKVAGEADKHITLYGQEKDNSVKSLAVMNMWMHGYEDATIKKGNTIAKPEHKEKDGKLKRFDRVVANPPFSIKNWSQGITPLEDEFKRFKGFGVPPEKNGDFAFLLHIIASLKNTGKGAVILPHGVLFRGNAEATIRENLIRRKLIKGIIGLPANLFYGTGIPACIVVIDKQNAKDQEELPPEKQGIFMMDASKGFIKDGNKNRLREQDIHKIVDVFNAQKNTPKYARFVPLAQIEANEFNLNIPRYIDTQDDEDIQDLDAHLNGGIPNRDINNLKDYWEVYPSIKTQLFEECRPEYSSLKTDINQIKEAITDHEEFKKYQAQMDSLFVNWRQSVTPILKEINIDTAPKKLIHEIAEDLLTEYTGKALVDRYDMYQHLMDYWLDVMKDDTYMIIEDGWVAKLKIVKETKREVVYDCELVPKYLVVNRYFPEDRDAIQEMEAAQEVKENELLSVFEEHSGEESIFDDPNINKPSKGEIESKLSEYQELAMSAYFPESFNLYKKDQERLEDLQSEQKEIESSDDYGLYLEKLTNSKGKLVKGNLQERVLELKSIILKSDLPTNLKDMVEPLKKSGFEKLNWQKGIQDPRFNELDVLYNYLSLSSQQSQLSREINKKRALLVEEIDKKKSQKGEYFNEILVLENMLTLLEEISDLKSQIQLGKYELEKKTLMKYKELTKEDVQVLVIDDKWMSTIFHSIEAEIDEISQRLSGRIKTLAERYEKTLGNIDEKVQELEEEVNGHLLKMGLTWG
ncbi:MAG: type I restriction-modification system subunit M [Oceanospirillaceae bacterium]|nr:type I restriction-modification system subunit M [Oceanospirillaceae bacterium]